MKSKKMSPVLKGFLIGLASSGVVALIGGIITKRYIDNKIKEVNK